MAVTVMGPLGLDEIFFPISDDELGFLEEVSQMHYLSTTL